MARVIVEVQEALRSHLQGLIDTAGRLCIVRDDGCLEDTSNGGLGQTGPPRPGLWI